MFRIGFVQYAIMCHHYAAVASQSMKFWHRNLNSLFAEIGDAPVNYCRYRVEFKLECMIWKNLNVEVHSVLRTMTIK